MISRTKYGVAVLPLCLSVISGAALGQSVLEEVVVVAQKREQNLQDVPIAITAFTGEQLNALGIRESVDIAMFTPGVHVGGSQAGQMSTFTIRGVTQNDFNDIVETPNAVYLDDGYLAIAASQTFAQFDLDRVEILKGPQGTLFGRNATGGLVHFISNAPSFDGVEGYVDFEIGEFDSDANSTRTVFQAAVGGPLSETVAARAAIRVSQHDGYLKNLYTSSSQLPFLGDPGPDAGADLGDEDTITGRVRFAFEPSDTLRMDLSFNYADQEMATGPYQSASTIAVAQEVNGSYELVNVLNTPPNETRLSMVVDANGNDTGMDAGADIEQGDRWLEGGGGGIFARPVPGGDLFGYLDPDGDDFTFNGDFAFEDQGSVETFGINFKLVKTIGDMNFTSVTDYKDYERQQWIDVDSAPVNQLANFSGVDATSFTQELRLDGETDQSRWVLGAFYLNIDTESDNGLKGPPGSFAAVFGGIQIDIGTRAELETDSYSVFGQYEYDFTDKLTLIGGARLMREEKDYGLLMAVAPSESSRSANTSPCFDGDLASCFPPAIQRADDTSETLWAGKLQVSYQYDDDLMLYAGVNRGVKAGSFNAPLLGAYFGGGGDDGLPYDEEVLTSYEAGFKATVLDGTTRINGTAFYYDYSDYQAFLFVGVGGVVVNKDAETYGAELEIQSSPAEGWDIIVSASYFDATVEDLFLRAGSPLPARDVKPTYAPEFQASALVRYGWDAMGGRLAVQADANYSDEFYYNLRNFDADKFDSYVMANAQLSFEKNDWLATLAVRNLTDERAGVMGFDLATLCGCNEVAYRAPRYVSVGLRKDF